ncbi:MAG TPA: enoyl-CoA hydratase/isomerase family protein [Polyangia bacterium]|jgi:enoyl-CoA hydratase
MSGLRVERTGDHAIFRLDKPRGNALDEPLIDAITAAIEAAALDDGVHGVMLASAHPSIFCPGLDLKALIDYDRGQMEQFIRKFTGMLRLCYGFPKPLVAAVGGHAVAGGCLLALTADYRVLRRDEARLGLNEVRIGVPMPWTVTVLIRATVPAPALTRVGLLGLNFTGPEAVAVGLADELADAGAVESTSQARLAELGDRDAAAYATTKTYLRATAIGEMRARQEELTADFVHTWFSDAFRARLRGLVQALGARSR